MPDNKETNEANTSDYECSNCGAVLKGVNNKQISVTTGKNKFRCICMGELIPIRNAPVNAPNSQGQNLGGGTSFPGMG
jgi:hypothetical protein